MDTTIFLAKVIGAFLLICGLSALVKQKSLPQLAEQFSSRLYLKYFGGMLVLIIGLLIVASHNLWSSPAQIIISLIGWGVLVKGAAFMLLPDNVLSGWMKFFTTTAWAVVGGLVGIVAGLYLLYIWYGAVV